MDDRSLLGSAFHELHGARLHGFAQLVTLGDAGQAARIASDALADGAAQARRLRHPERAAAWLRARVTRAAMRRRRFGGRRPTELQRSETLERLGVTSAAFVGLAALTPHERAALVAAELEHLDPLDVATVVGVEDGRLARLVARARRRYAIAAAGAEAELPAEGPLGTRVHALAGWNVR